MSYAPPSRPRRGGGGMIFFVILAVIGYMIFSNRGRPAPNPAGGDDMAGSRQVERELPTDRYGSQKERDLLGGGDFQPAAGGKKMPTTGGTAKSSDWDMQGFDGPKKPAQNAGGINKGGGDWALDDVDVEKKKENQFQFSNPATKNKPQAGGDWSIDDAGGKQTPKIYKTENGDWAIEDANPNKKK